MILTQKNFDKLVNLMNHNVTSISKDVRQMKHIIIGTSIIYAVSAITALLFNFF